MILITLLLITTIETIIKMMRKQKIKNVDFEASAGKAVAFNIREIYGSNPAIGNFIYCQLFFNPIISKNPK